VTFSPEDAPFSELRSFLDSVGGEVVSRADDSRQMWRLGHGVVTFEQRARFARASASGGALDHMRDRDSFYGYLSTLAEQPHAVTRLDACFDTESPGHVVVADLWRRYPRSCSLRRKAIATKRIVSTDADGHETGTFYENGRIPFKPAGLVPLVRVNSELGVIMVIVYFPECQSIYIFCEKGRWSYPPRCCAA